MRHALFILLLFAGCCKEPQRTIDGVWRQTFAPHSIYSFSNGICIQRVMALESEVYRNEYAYTVTGEEMTLTDLESGTVHNWTLNFDSDSTCEINTGSLFVLSLKRYPW